MTVRDPRRRFLLACITVSVLLAATVVSSYAAPCAAMKSKCAAKHLGVMLKCQAKAEMKAGFDVAACVNRAISRFTGGARGVAVSCFGKAEQKYGAACPSRYDVLRVARKIETHVDGIVEMLNPGPPPHIINTCQSLKKKCVARKALGLMKCREACSKNPSSCDAVLAACESRVRADFDGGEAGTAAGCFGKLEARGGCLTTGDVLTVELAVDDMVDDIAGRLDDPCDEAAVLDPEGNVVLPVGATDVEAEEEISRENPLPVSDLYAGVDTTTDSFYPLPCDPSIGGDYSDDELEALDVPDQDEVDAEQYLEDYEDTGAIATLVSGLKSIALPTPPSISSFTVGDCFIGDPMNPENEVDCDSPRFLRSDEPFEGRDIIYVNGLYLDHIKDEVQGAGLGKWPADQSDFLDNGKYFRDKAKAYWEEHIRENLFDPLVPASTVAGWQHTISDGTPRYVPKGNRYLIAAWSSAQTLDFGQDALMQQIYLAMAFHRNVVTPPTYPADWYRPFCSNGCILIGHSTGPLLISTTMGRAVTGDWGPGGNVIVDHMAAHIAFESALSGSRLATIGMAVGTSPPVGNAATNICAIVNEFFDPSPPCQLNPSLVSSSIFRDLIPEVAQEFWKTYIELSPVPTVMVAGGHPIGNYGFGVTKYFLPGLDDGVVTMNSACANPNQVRVGGLAPSGMTVTSLRKAFDMGIPFLTALKNFTSSRSLRTNAPASRYLSSGCTPWLSTTGMIMPVDDDMSGTPNLNARERYPNHYSFLHGAVDHSHDGGGADGNIFPSTALGTPASVSELRNYTKYLGDDGIREETRVVVNHDAYTRDIDSNLTKLLRPIPLVEYERGRVIRFRLFGKRREWWIWKRTYHLAHLWQTKQTCHYAYEFVGRR